MRQFVEEFSAPNGSELAGRINKFLETMNTSVHPTSISSISYSGESFDHVRAKAMVVFDEHGV